MSTSQWLSDMEVLMAQKIPKLGQPECLMKDTRAKMMAILRKMMKGWDKTKEGGRMWDIRMVGVGLNSVDMAMLRSN